jgi:hypothetical protein
MGTISNNRRLFLAVLGIAALGLILDRTVFSGAGFGPENAAASTSRDPALLAALAAKDSQASQNAASRLADRLNAFAKEKDLSVEDTPDAFLAPAAFGPAPAVSPAAAPAAKTPDAADKFLEDHKLNTVLFYQANEGASRIVLDGKALAIGAVIDGFMLKSIARRAAAFERDGVTVVMIPNEKASRIVLDGQALAVGAVIDGFTLKTINGRAATFERDGVTVVLTLPER